MRRVYEVSISDFLVTEDDGFVYLACPACHRHLLLDIPVDLGKVQDDAYTHLKDDCEMR